MRHLCAADLSPGAARQPGAARGALPLHRAKCAPSRPRPRPCCWRDDLGAAQWGCTLSGGAVTRTRGARSRVGDRPTRSASRGGGCPATKELATTTRAARCMRLHDSLLGFLLCKLPQRLSTAPERLCSARFCAPSALRPPGGPQTLTLLPPAGPSTPQPLLAVLRCASAPAKHGAAEDSWPIRDTTTFSPGVCPLMSRQFSHLLRLALPTAVSGRQVEDHPAKRRRIEELEKASQALVAKRRAVGLPSSR